MRGNGKVMGKIGVEASEKKKNIFIEKRKTLRYNSAKYDRSL